MATQERQVGGINEAPLAVVGERVVPQQPDDQTGIEPSQLEYIRYSELFQSFQEKLLRWQSVICTPENEEPPSYHDDSIQWGVHIAYPSDKPYIIPEDELNTDTRSVSIIAAIGTGGRPGQGFGIELSGFKGHHLYSSEFIDPYTNKEISILQFDIQTATFTKLQKDGTRDQEFWNSLLITKDYGEALELSIDNLEGEVRLRVGENTRAQEGTTLLSVDHAKALFDLVDSIVPHVQTQLPEPATAGEQ